MPHILKSTVLLYILLLIYRTKPDNQRRHRRSSGRHDRHSLPNGNNDRHSQSVKSSATKSQSDGMVVPDAQSYRKKGKLPSEKSDGNDQSACKDNKRNQSAGKRHVNGGQSEGASGKSRYSAGRDYKTYQPSGNSGISSHTHGTDANYGQSAIRTGKGNQLGRQTAKGSQSGGGARNYQTGQSLAKGRQGNDCANDATTIRNNGQSSMQHSSK